MTTTIDLDAITQVLDPLDQWSCQCHAASITLVKSGVLPSPCRVARGSGESVGGQHSWVVLSDDVYDPTATVIDPTLWSYDPEVEGIWVGKNRERHNPQQSGSIWDYGRPVAGDGPVIELKPRSRLSYAAREFLRMVGPLDDDGWRHLAHFPMEGWPSQEIISAMCEDLRLRAWIPIDIEGMLTSRNPKGLYLP
jgi:hypothetical protein